MVRRRSYFGLKCPHLVAQKSQDCGAMSICFWDNRLYEKIAFGPLGHFLDLWEFKILGRSMAPRRALSKCFVTICGLMELRLGVHLHVHNTILHRRIVHALCLAIVQQKQSCMHFLELTNGYKTLGLSAQEFSGSVFNVLQPFFATVFIFWQICSPKPPSWR